MSANSKLFIFWPRNVAKCGICYTIVCPSVTLSVCHTCDRQFGSRYRNVLCTMQRHISSFLRQNFLFMNVELVR